LIREGKVRSDPQNKVSLGKARLGKVRLGLVSPDQPNYFFGYNYIFD
jgi:hypothetical protein